MNVNDPRWASIDAFVEENRDNILRDITRLVAVPSVEGAPEPGAPFGPGPKAALAKALEIAEELGLSTCNADSYIGWAETGTIADDQKFLATITHTDVVPEGNGWDADPYTVRVRDGWLLGRGVADDKGPSILCLYALKYLKDSGAALKYPVRALLGANEETNMHDVDYYAEHYPMPAFCFTPDAEFPVCNGEKGGFNGEIVSPKLDGIQLSFVQFFVVSVLSTIFAFVFEAPSPDQFRAAAVSIAYCGIMSSGVAYTLQIVGQKALDPTIASLAMCLESVFSALAGWLILGETLSTTELCGCGLMFAAIVASQLPDKKKV